MGASSSSVDTKGVKIKKGNKQYHKEPAKRLKERFDPEENTNFTSQHDASIDKVTQMYHQTLVASAM